MALLSNRDIDRTLADGIQALPQELQDEVLSYLLLLPGGPIRINKTYKPPLALSLDRAHRDYATQVYYYPTREFHFTSTDQELCRKWLSSLSNSYLSQLRICVSSRPSILTWDWNGIFSRAGPEIQGFNLTQDHERELVVYRLVLEGQERGEGFVARLVFW